ncbi:2OG-Fe(II) oxygenase family protein [Streptomyces aureoversilis]|uniref:2OG-Fe(II) oxygenase family protein n=1 Tax=Streptomyces aureoversilis TaxID=67277 RepID=A0ABV9ZWK6_9ACTN
MSSAGSSGPAIPTVDLSSEKAVAEIGEVCRRSGFFSVRGHGIPAALVTSAFEETARFYARPLREKTEFNAGVRSQFLGYRSVGQEKSTSHAGGEACEQYRIGRTTGALASGRPADFYHEPFRRCSALFERMAVLGDTLLSACAEGLAQSSDFFDPYLKPPMHRLGLNYYKVGYGAEIANTVDYAMSPHVDHALFTVVAQDEPGLEVRGADGDWTPVPVVPDTFFVFLGDYLQRWTNGTYKAVFHRVGPVTTDRMSIQYKHRPSYSTVVAPLDPFVSAANPPRYEPFDTGSQYASLLASLIGDREAAP